jgi:hypothetical protein
MARFQSVTPTRALAALAFSLFFLASATAQQNNRPAGNQQGPLGAVFDPGGIPAGGPGDNPGAPGGSSQADFDALIDLITSTVEKDTWAENGTGEGDIMPFAINGVYADADRALAVAKGQRKSLASIRDRGAPIAAAATADSDPKSARNAKVDSPLRYVSLPKLEAAIAARQRAHKPLDRDMLALAGLERIQYVLVYPESGDLVLAGPAGDWREGPGGALISAATGRPVVRLDDLLALWRRARDERSAPFGCSIVPRQEALARTQDFLAASAADPIEPSERREWLQALRDTLGLQDVEYYNVAKESRLARILLAADYHMKLVGMGLAEGVPGVKSYLATVRVPPGGSPPPMTVLRWWFAMPEFAVATTDEHDAFALPDRCVEVLSENEMLAARGERVHTGQSDELNSRFAESFTANYGALVDKYPIYGELERVFELALAIALVEREGLTKRVDWAPTLLLDDQRLRLPKAAPLEAVETVINHRVIGGRHIIAGVSGGVWLDGGKRLAVSAADQGAANRLAQVKKPAQEQPAPPADGAAGEIVWWWD